MHWCEMKISCAVLVFAGIGWEKIGFISTKD